MKFILTSLGEVLWDLLPSGRQLGGAPANFACHACALGAEARLVSRVGRDSLGRQAVSRLATLGVVLDALEVDPSAPTGTVGVVLAPDGQPQFQIHEHVAWDHLIGEAAGRAAVAVADAVCFGTLGQRSEPARSSIRALIAAAPSRALRVFDVNLRQNYFSKQIIAESLALANVLKVNETELPRLAEMFGLPGDDHAQISQLAARYNLRLTACTRGDRGSLLFSGGVWSDDPGRKTRVVDTIGAGDSFTAAMTIGFLGGWDLNEINRRANDVAAYVCSQPGATPELPQGLRIPFRACIKKSNSGLEPL